MSTRKEMPTVFIDAVSGLDTTLPDCTQVFTKDTAQLWVLNNGSYALMTSGVTIDGWTTIVKSADQDVTNNTYQPDSEFNFSVVAGGIYAVDIDLIFSVNTAFQYAPGFSAGTGTMKGKGSIKTNVSNGTLVSLAANAAASTTLSTTNISAGDAYAADLDLIQMTNIQFGFKCTSATTVYYTFGQGTAGVGRTSRTFKGSVMKYKKLN